MAKMDLLIKANNLYTIVEFKSQGKPKDHITHTILKMIENLIKEIIDE